MARNWGALITLLCALIAQIGCSDLVGADFNVHGRAPDASTRADAGVDVIDSGSAEVSSPVDAVDVSEARDGESDVADAPDVTDVSNATDVSDAIDASNLTDVSNTTDVSNATDATDVTETTDAADTSSSLDASSDVNDADAATDASPCVPDRCNGTCANDRCLELVTTGLPGISGVAADDTYVYWSNYDHGGVWRAPLGVPSALAIRVAAGDTLQGAAVGGGRVYWAVGTADGSIQSAPAAPVDGGVSMPSPFISGQMFPVAVTADGAFVYWANPFGDSSILRAPLGSLSADTEAVVLVQGDLNTPNCLAVNSTTLFWVDSDGTLKVASLGATIVDNPAMTTVSFIAPGTHGLAVDDENIYWVDPGKDPTTPNGRILRHPLVVDSTVPTTLIADGQANPNALFVDAKYVYWGNRNTGDIFRTAK